MLKFTLKQILIIIFTLLFCEINLAQIGIHQIQKNNFGRNYDDSIKNSVIEKILSKTNKSLTHNVFGYLPYWENQNYQYINYNLLTHIALFDFAVDENGNLTIPQNIFVNSWNAVINNAHNFDVKVLMTATNFDSLQIEKIIRNETAKTNFFNNVKTVITQNNLDGIIVDFEGPKIADRGEVMNNFMNELNSFINSENSELEVAFSSPAVNWGGWWNLKGLAESCDYLFLMGYDYYGNWSSTTGPTSPLKGGTQNLTHSLDSHYKDVVENYPHKLILGIPYYGLHFKSESADVGSAKVDTVTSPRYRESAEVYDQYGKYWESSFDVSYSFWLEDNLWDQYFVDTDTSISLKYDLAIERNLKGVGIWALGYDGSKPELWNLLAKKFETTVSIDDSHKSIPQNFILLQNYPNPFNPSTKIGFFINEPSEVQLKIYDVLGKLVRDFEIDISNSGYHFITWNGKDNFENTVSSGMYFYKAEFKGESGKFLTQTRKMILVK